MRGCSLRSAATGSGASPGSGLENTLVTVLTGLGALYVALLVTHALVQPDLRLSPLVAFGSITALLLLTFRWIWSYWRIPARWFESVGSLLAALPLLLSVAHLHALSGFQEALNLGLLGAGIMSFFLSLSRLALVQVVTLCVWAVLAFTAGASLSWLYYVFGLFAATGLKVHSVFRKTELQKALDRAHFEIHTRESVEHDLRENKERYELVARATNDGLWDWDLKKGEIYFSPRWRTMIGAEEGEVHGQPEEWFDRVCPQDLGALRKAIVKHLEGESPHFTAEYRLRHQDGGYRWMLCRGVAVRDEKGRPCRVAGSQADISDRKWSEEQLYQQAFQDELTGLPNRALLSKRLERAIDNSRQSGKPCFVVLFLDLDRFKNVNDSLGHLLGDELLKSVASRLLKSGLSMETVARLGGDEFVLLDFNVANERQALRIGNRVRRELNRPYLLAGREIYLTASIGIAWGRPDYRTPTEVLRDADTAMYQAKLRGRDRCEFFDRSMHSQAVDLLQLENDLRRALKHDEFTLHYQPIVSLQGGATTGVEALLRWQHPRQGLLSPKQFLWLAEETGMIVPLSWWGLREACSQLRCWLDTINDASALTINVNLAGKQVMQPDLVPRTLEILEETGLPARHLRLEVTESALLRNQGGLTSRLSQLQDSGVKIHLDDFGTGYSSLSYLHRFSFDALKIDRSFMRSQLLKSGNRKIVEAMVELAHDLGMKVIVEGLENEEQVSLARKLNCEYGQGYYFSAALSARRFGEYLRSQKTVRQRRNLVSIRKIS